MTQPDNLSNNDKSLVAIFPSLIVTCFIHENGRYFTSSTVSTWQCGAVSVSPPTCCFAQPHSSYLVPFFQFLFLQHGISVYLANTNLSIPLGKKFSISQIEILKRPISGDQYKKSYTELKHSVTVAITGRCWMMGQYYAMILP